MQFLLCLYFQQAGWQLPVLEQLANELGQLALQGFSGTSLPRNAGRRAFACRRRAFQVSNALACASVFHLRSISEIARTGDFLR